MLWHPFTQMQEWEESDPLFITEGRGVRLCDRDGNWYYDANSSLWVNIHGHRRPELDEALKRQSEKIAHSTFLGLTHEPALLLAEQLVRLAPAGLTRVFYSDSGSEAVEIALKIACQYWRQRGQPERTAYIALEESYHGDTLGAVSVGGIELFHEIFRPLLFRTRFAPSPVRGASPHDALEAMERLMAEHAGETAAVIVEPLVQGAAGMLTHPDGFLTEVRRLCTRYDLLLIADEVATGFGRTGRLFACEHEAVSPDLLCLAKGITGGYLPLAATLAAEPIYEVFLGAYEEWKTFFHGHSYTANPLACAVAIESLRLLEQETLPRLPELAALVELELAPLTQLRNVREVRGRGLMWGIDLWNGTEAYPPGVRAGAAVCRTARSLGLITRPLGDLVVFMPPLASSPDELRDMIRILSSAIETAGLP